jgi:hypothetical protein
VNRERQLKSIAAALHGERLIWFGTRGIDAAPLLELDAFSGVISLIAPLGMMTRPAFAEESLELISGDRVDLDVYSTDRDDGEAVKTLHRGLLRMLRKRSALATYRPCDFLSAAYFPRARLTRYLGMFAAHALAYDHKPWVESGLRAAGVPVLPWEYYHDEDLDVLAEAMHGRAFVLRANYSDGGAGLCLVPAGADPREHVPLHGGGFLAATPYLESSIPLNVSGCVFPDGSVTARAPSLQLIGLDCCTSREFGYCGNDFATVWDAIGAAALDDLEQATTQAGRWLHRTGFVGAFGLDALFSEGRLHVTEVNPRFQGCSAAASAMAARTGSGDVYLDHLAAFLGLPRPTDALPLREQALLQAKPAIGLSQIVCSNTGRSVRVGRKTVVPDSNAWAIAGVPHQGIRVAPEGMLFKLVIGGSVTTDGSRIAARLREVIQELSLDLFSAPS